MNDSFRDYVDFATEIACRAGQLTLGYFQTGVRPDFKPDDSPVTIADRKAEELIRREIEDAFPDHAIVGEEFGTDDREGATHRWYIDPIDGTRAFVRGVPLYAVLIGLEVHGRSEVGVAYFPALGEVIAAATGEGCRWNGRPARTSSVAALNGGIVTTAPPPPSRSTAGDRRGSACSVAQGSVRGGPTHTRTSSWRRDAPRWHWTRS